MSPGGDFGTDMHDTGFVEVLQRFFRNVRNVAGDFLRTKLGVAGHHFIFLDMDRGEDVLHGDLFAEQDGVFEVVAIPRHERDEHVAAESQIAQFGRRTIGDDVALASTWSPTTTSGRWLMQVDWFERWNFIRL